MKLADTCIAGIGESRCGKVPDRSALPEAVRIGMRVQEVEFEKQDEDITLRVFRFLV